ncbi:MAG TPA: hypothetical protein VD813_14540 [Pseudonocardia sp.]|nr:hypothetical protein [Pseudonocardia sp.]
MKRFATISALLAAGAMALFPSPASAGPRPPSTVDITVTEAGFTSTPAVAGGAVTLRVRSEDPAGAWIGLVRLRPGVTLDRYVEHLRQAMSDDPATAVEGGRAVSEDAVMLGGPASAQVPASASLHVPPGDYLLVDFRDVHEPDFAQRIRPLIVGPGGGRPAPAPDAVIAATESGFRAPAELVSGAPVLVANRLDQYNEAMVMPVRPGTTLTEVDAFFDGTGDFPFAGGPTGIVPMSPGRTAVLEAALPPGEYALVTWVRDLDTGRMLAQEGMRELVRILPAG